MKPSHEARITKDKVDHFAGKTAQTDAPNTEGEHATGPKVQISTVEKLLGEPRGRNNLDAIFRRVFYQYINCVPAGYTPEDLRQDVLTRFMQKYPADTEPEKLFAIIARMAANMLISMRRTRNAKRNGGNKLDSLTEDEHIIGSDDGFESTLEGADLLVKCRNTLTGNDLDLFDEHILNGKNFARIARERVPAVTRQDVSAQWGRIVKKLRLFVGITEDQIRRGPKPRRTRREAR
jgi:DNA-directed RNA polymerase specialized sigma24 family protein